MVEQAVILTDLFAAGTSGKPGDPHKVLFGLTLLERCILALSHGGIQRILVLGREADWSLLARLRDDNRLKGSGTTLQWADAGNTGATLPLPHASFLLLGGMVVFTTAMAQWIKRLHTGQNWLLTPAGMDGCPGFSSCGMAVCRAEMFPRLFAVRVNELDALFAAAASEAKPVQDHAWVVVNSRQTERQARRLLRQSMGKPSDGFFSRHLNRQVSWPISRALIRLRVRPTQVTIVNLALGLYSGWLIGQGGYGPTLAAGLLFQFVSIFDGCDGEIARLTFRFSDLGTRLDNLCDFVTLAVFFINLPIGLYAATADVFYLALGAFMLLVLTVFYLLLMLRIKVSGHRGNIAEMARQVQDKGKTKTPLHWLDHLGIRLGFLYRKEFISLFVMICCLIDRAEVILVSIAFFVSIGLVYQVYSSWQLWIQANRLKGKV